jgi:hypothetical protein
VRVGTTRRRTLQLRRKLPKRSDAVLGRRMSRKQIVDAVAGAVENLFGGTNDNF